MATSRADVKNNLRRRLRAQREERYVEHTLLHLLEIPEISQSTVVASYHSYGFEPHTHELNRALIAQGKKLLLPRINGENIDWVEWDGLDKSLIAQGKFHEPVGDVYRNHSAIDVVLVPALAIDPEGYRLGQGVSMIALLPILLHGNMVWSITMSGWSMTSREIRGIFQSIAGNYLLKSSTSIKRCWPINLHTQLL